MNIPDEDRKILVLKFCECSSWAHDCWLLHRALFDDNKDKEQTIGKIRYLSHTISAITQEYLLLQIAKLHDQVQIGDQLNVTVDSVFKAYDWGDVRVEVVRLRDVLLGLWTNIKTARHQVLAHNDFETLKSGTVHGQFTLNLDKRYFAALQAYVNLAHDKALGGPYPFGHHTETDVFELLNMLRKA